MSTPPLFGPRAADEAPELWTAEEAPKMASRSEAPKSAPRQPKVTRIRLGTACTKANMDQDAHQDAQHGLQREG